MSNPVKIWSKILSQIGQSDFLPKYVCKDGVTSFYCNLLVAIFGPSRYLGYHCNGLFVKQAWDSVVQVILLVLDLFSVLACQWPQNGWKWLLSLYYPLNRQIGSLTLSKRLNKKNRIQILGIPGNEPGAAGSVCTNDTSVLCRDKVTLES